MALFVAISNMRGLKAKQRKCSTNSQEIYLYKMQVYNKSNPLRWIIFLLFPFTSIKLFTLPDKSQIEKKVQELERILLALQKNSVREFCVCVRFFVCFFINCSDRINTKALRCIVMPLKTRLVVIISWNQQWFTEKKRPSQRCFLWSSIKTFTYLRLRKGGPVDLAWDTNYLLLCSKISHVLLVKPQPAWSDLFLFLEYSGSQFLIEWKLIETMLRI